MMQRITFPRLATGLAAGLALLLAGCMLMPGKFTSALDIRKDGRFSFRYIGEIHVLAFAKRPDALAKFTPRPCHAAGSGSERECTREEIAEQKAQWQKDRDTVAERRKQDSDSARMLLGGIDPDDPRSAEELAERLRKQAGWRKVQYKGEGLFDVDFAISGRLDHDFQFPTFERFPMANALVQISLRQDGTVRVDAPGFGAMASSYPMQAMMMMGTMAGEEQPAGQRTPVPDGSFTLTTDARVLANNTDEGPQPDPAGSRLAWTVNARTPAAPGALLRLGD